MSGTGSFGPQASTPEYLTLRKTYRVLITHIKTQPGNICDALFESGYIPSAVRDLTRNRSILNEEKAQKLVDTIIDRVAIDTSVYHGFIDILKSEGPWAETITEKLTEQFKKEQAAKIKVSSNHSLPDPPTEESGNLPNVFERSMTPSDLCKWLTVKGLHKNVITTIRKQDVDGDSFLQLSELSKEDLVKSLKCDLTFGAYNKLKNLLKEAQESKTKRRANITAWGFVCPFCKKCSVKQFFSEAGCPHSPKQAMSPTETLFPYLNHTALSENERLLVEGRLMDDTREMICLFARTEDSLIVSFEDRKINLFRLRNYTVHLVKKVGTKSEIESLEAAKAIPELFYSLHPFKSFFHYEVIESVVKQFGNDDDQQLMEKYVSKFKKFCERSVFEVPPNIFHDSDPKPGDKVFSVKFTPEEHASLGDVVAVRRKLANILKIDVLALQLCCITDGCVCLRFLVSAHVAETIFPMTESQMSALSDIHVKVLEDPGSLEDEDVPSVEDERTDLLAKQLSHIMSERLLPFCTAPPDLFDVFQNLYTQSGAAGACVAKDKVWKGRQSLRVFFMNPEVLEGWKFGGEKLTTDKILKRANVWERAPSAPTFVETRNPKRADLRVKFSDEEGCWSLEGMRASSYDQSKPTMVLNFSSETLPERFIKHVIAHEFGHALGLGHEHQSSDFWNVVKRFMDTEKMKSDLGLSGEKACQVDWLFKEEAGGINVEYDSQSIMRYWFRVDWLKNKDYCVPQKIESDPHLTQQEKQYLLSIHESYADNPSPSDIMHLEEAYSVRFN